MTELKTAFVEFRPPDIFFSKLKNTEAEMTGDEYLEILDFCIAAIGERPYVSLVDARGIHMNFSPQARHLNAKHPHVNAFKIAEAVVSDSITMKLIVNMYTAFNKPAIPTKIFSNEESATEWLNEQRLLFKPRKSGNGNAKDSQSNH